MTARGRQSLLVAKVTVAIDRWKLFIKIFCTWLRHALPVMHSSFDAYETVHIETMKSSTQLEHKRQLVNFWYAPLLLLYLQCQFANIMASHTVCMTSSESMTVIKTMTSSQAHRIRHYLDTNRAACQVVLGRTHHRFVLVRNVWTGLFKFSHRTLHLCTKTC